MFYQFRNNTNENIFVVVEATDSNNAISLADGYGFKTEGDDADWTYISTNEGDELPTITGIIVAEFIDGEYITTGLINAQAIYSGGISISY